MTISEFYSFAAAWVVVMAIQCMPARLAASTPATASSNTMQREGGTSNAWAAFRNTSGWDLLCMLSADNMMLK